MSLELFDERTVLNYGRLVLPADGIASLVLAAANSGDRRIDTLLVANRDTIPHVVTVQRVATGVTTVLGSASIPAGQGFNGTPTLDLLALIFPSTQVGIKLINTSTLNIQLAVAVAATFDMSFTAFGGAF